MLCFDFFPVHTPIRPLGKAVYKDQELRLLVSGDAGSHELRHFPGIGRRSAWFEGTDRFDRLPPLFVRNTEYASFLYGGVLQEDLLHLRGIDVFSPGLMSSFSALRFTYQR